MLKMNVRPLLLTVIINILWIFVMVNGAVVVQETKPGLIVELPCLSNDDNHRFMFWELLDEKNIISPDNLLDTNKYRYDVLTGTLSIRSISTVESGFYKCISKGINDSTAINVQVIELIVKKDWEDLWENDFETNLLRCLAAVMIIVVAIAVVLYIITNKRHEGPRYFDLDVSRENSPPIYGKGSRGTAGVVLADSPYREEDGIDNSVEVDFPKVFRKMHQDQAVGMS